MYSISLFELVFAVLFGGLLGSFYFAILWITVKYLARIRLPALWVLLSLLLRIGTVLTGLYWVSKDGWPMLISALMGMLVIRQWFTQHLQAETNHKA